MKKLTFILPLFVLVCLCGCGEKTSVASSNGPIRVFDVPPETVLATVNGRALTAQDFRFRLAFETGVFSYTMQYAAQKPKDGAARVALFERQRLSGVMPQLVHCALLDAYLESACGGRDVKYAEKEFAKAVNRLMPKKARKEGLEGLAKAIGLTPEYVKEQVLVSAREDKARLVFEPASTNVTEKEIDEGLARMDAYTAMAVATNRATWATASNVLAQIKAGADFAKLGRTNGDAGGEATEWATFERDEFENASLRDWAFSAKDGAVGGPFEVDDGVSIVKVLRSKAGTDVASLASAGAAEVTLARINFPLFEENPEPKTRQHCREALLAWKANQAKERLFKKLLNEAKIAYPNGGKLDFGEKARPAKTN